MTLLPKAYLILTLMSLIGGATHLPLAIGYGNPIGKVCISEEPNRCPSTVPVLTSKSDSLTVYVVVDGSDSFDQYRVLIKTDPSILNPLSANVSGSVLGSPVSVFAECVNGISPRDSGECLPQDGPGVVDIGVTGVPTFPTTTGLLLEIRYRVLANTPNTPIGFANACLGSSTSTGTCVFLNDTRIIGSSTSMPATVQLGNFENLPYSTGDFAISTHTPSISTPRGMSVSANVTVSSKDEFNGTLSLEVRSSTNDIIGLMNQNALTLLAGETIVSDLKVRSLLTATPGTYTITVVASIGLLSHSLVISIELLQTQTVNLVQNGGFDSQFAFWQYRRVQEVSILDPSDQLKDERLPAFQIADGSEACTPGEKMGTSFAQIESSLGSNGFLEQVLAVPVDGAGLTFHTWGRYKQSNSPIGTVVVVSQIENRFTLDTFAPPSSQDDAGECTGSSPILKTYDLADFAGQTIRLRLSGQAFKCCSALIMYDDVQVVPYGQAALPTGQGTPDFAITAVPDTVAIVGLDETVRVEVDLVSVNNFSGNVSLQVSSLAGLSTYLNTTAVNIQRNETRTLSLFLSHPYGTPISQGWIEISGYSGPVTRSAQIYVNLGLFLSPDFTIRLSQSPILLNTGSSTSATIRLTSLGGFARNVTFSYQVLETLNNGPTASVSPSSVKLESFGSATTVLTVSATDSAPIGNYTILLMGTNGFFGITHYMIIPSTVGSISPTTNSHTTSTTLSCASPVALHSPSTCIATVDDLATVGSTAPTGTVTFNTSSSSGSYTFSSSECTLTANTGGNARCQVSYIQSIHYGLSTITAAYSGDPSHAVSSGQYAVTVSPRTFTTVVSCQPSDVSLGHASTCTVTVTDTSSTPIVPNGSVGFATDSFGSFSGSPCALIPLRPDSASCSVAYTPRVVGNMTQTVTASYSGDSTHASGSGHAYVTVTLSSNDILAAMVPWVGLGSAFGIAIASVVFVSSRRRKTHVS